MTPEANYALVAGESSHSIATKMRRLDALTTRLREDLLALESVVAFAKDVTVLMPVDANIPHNIATAESLVAALRAAITPNA